MESDCVDLRMCDIFIGFLVDHWTSQYERVIFVVIAICVDLNTTVRACYFKIGLLQCMLVSYMVMLFHSLLWHVAMSKMGIWFTEKPLCQVSYGLLPGNQIDFSCYTAPTSQLFLFNRWHQAATLMIRDRCACSDMEAL